MVSSAPHRDARRWTAVAEIVVHALQDALNGKETTVPRAMLNAARRFVRPLIDYQPLNRHGRPVSAQRFQHYLLVLECLPVAIQEDKEVAAKQGEVYLACLQDLNTRPSPLTRESMEATLAFFRALLREADRDHAFSSNGGGAVVTHAKSRDPFTVRVPNTLGRIAENHASIERFALVLEDGIRRHRAARM